MFKSSCAVSFQNWKPEYLTIMSSLQRIQLTSHQDQPIQTSDENNQCQQFCNEFVCILFPGPSRQKRYKVQQNPDNHQEQHLLSGNKPESVSTVNGAWWLHLCQSYGIMVGEGGRNFTTFKTTLTIVSLCPLQHLQNEIEKDT